jgi:hypothetical protein
MQFVILAEHPPQLCPTANAKTREMMKQGSNDIPALAQKLGLQILTLRAFGGDHIVLAVVEAADIEKVRNFVMESRLIQWNTIKIHPTWSMEEALEKADKLPPLF